MARSTHEKAFKLLRIQDVAALVNLSEEHLKAEACYILGRFHNQKPRSFNARWRKWENGGKMPAKVDAYLRSSHHVGPWSLMTPAEKAEPRFPDQDRSNALAVYREAVIAKYVAENPCTCR
jgi:hypothetical protein